MKKTFRLSILFFIMVLLAACDKSSSQNPESSDTENAEIANPFVDYDNIEDACEAAGFGMIIPESIEGYRRGQIQAIEGELVQAFYVRANGKNETSDESADTKNSEEILVRKAKGNNDISGDYNTYKIEKTVSAGDREILLHGDTNDSFHVATWTQDDFSYAIDADAALSENEFLNIISVVM